MSGQSGSSDWGGWPSVALESPDLRLVVVPALGARVVSLVDLRTGREWLVQGHPPTRAEARSWSRHGVAFLGRQAFGWDECVPTVAPCPDPLDPCGPRLRDHGDLWGRATTAAADHEGLATTWTGQRWPYRFRRRLSLTADAVHCTYELTNEGDRDLPILWSMHALLELEPGALIQLPPTELSITFATGLGVAATDSMRWPDIPGGDGGSVDLSVVRAADARFAAKLYADPAPSGPARAVAPDGASIAFMWPRDVAPALGLWLDYGGWPDPSSGVRQVAIEPTTSGHDDLQDAISAGQARLVRPGDKVAWEVRVEVSPGRTRTTAGPRR